MTKGNTLKKKLKETALEICGEEDRFRGEKISLASLQISTDLSDIEQAKFSGHGHHREDIAKYFQKDPHGNIKYDQLFEELKRRVENISEKGSTSQAKENFLLTHGNLVVISGQPGIGKSTMTKRIVEEMWEKSLFDPEIVFFIRLRETDFTRETDLLQFLAPFVSNDFLSDEDRKKILRKLEDTEKVFIIMDGLDEANIDPPFMNQPTLQNFDFNTIAKAFIQNLISGKILRNSKKIITSRPYRLSQLPKTIQPKVIFTIQGLDVSALKQICLCICNKNNTLCNKILNHLQHNPDIKSYCHTPVICIMVMKALNAVYAANETDKNASSVDCFSQNNSFDTLTAIFVYVLKEWLIEKLVHSGKFQIKEISELAFNGFIEDQFYFREFDLEKANVNFQNNATFLNTILKGKKIMYFIHLMWQEFLVAVRLTLYSSITEFKSIVAKLDDGKYEVVTRFLFGLCNKDTLDDLLDYVKVKHLSSESDRKECTEMLKQFAINRLKIVQVPEHYRINFMCNTKLFHDFIERDAYQVMLAFRSIIQIMGLVHEFGDDDFAKHAAAWLWDTIVIAGVNLLPGDISSISYVLRHRGRDLELIVDTFGFVKTCSEYFFKELHKTLNQNLNIKVS